MPRAAAATALHRALVGREKLSVLDEVPDAVARQRHLRRDDEIGAAAPRPQQSRRGSVRGVAEMSPLVGLI